jgi:hypothetical protein
MARTTISAAVLAVLLLGACASQPTAPTLAPGAAKRAVDGSVPTGTVIAWVPIQADVRDGPDVDGSCAGHLVVPKEWLLDVAGGAKVAPNGDGTAQTTMSACEGELAVPPQIPSQVTAIN